MINTLCVKISRKGNEDGRDFVVSVINYEPQRGMSEALIRMVNDCSLGDYVIEAGFILKVDEQNKYPTFYRQTFSLKK